MRKGCPTLPVLAAIALSGVVPIESVGAPAGPNIVFVLVDDLGYGDFSCTGNRDVVTARIDRLAREGTRFTQFYSASPICSPSRVAFTTGQYPQRWRIHSYLSSRQANRQRDMADWLDPRAPTLARAFQEAGYATAHFGKWHMGGGRDVGDAPLPQAYGFAESLTSFEGLGDRVLPPGRLSEQSAQLGRGTITRAPKHELTGIYVDRAIDFIQRHRQQPFYVHLWLDDVHDEHVPSREDLAKYARLSHEPHRQRLCAVLDRMDQELGRLFEAIDRQGLAERTLVLLTGDNGPTAWPRYYADGGEAPGSTAGFRGRKWSLYEGGIRLPLIARWTGTIPAGRVDESTVISALDFFPTLCRLAGVELPPATFDGEDMSRALLGETVPRRRPLFWEYRQDLKPGRVADQSPTLALRDGRWKYLVDADGSRPELYDLERDPFETTNLAEEPASVALRNRLAEALDDWRAQMAKPPHEGSRE